MLLLLEEEEDDGDKWLSALPVSVCGCGWVKNKDKIQGRRPRKGRRTQSKQIVRAQKSAHQVNTMPATDYYMIRQECWIRLRERLLLVACERRMLAWTAPRSCDGMVSNADISCGQARWCVRQAHKEHKSNQAEHVLMVEWSIKGSISTLIVVLH